MKKLLIVALAIMPLGTMAQSEWELPENPTTETQKEKQKKQKTAATVNKSKKNEIKKIDPRYAAGAVPEVNGKVQWDTTIIVPGISADELYDRTLKTIKALATDSVQSVNSRIAAVNKREHIIAARFDEEMVFSASFISKDYTQFRYTLIANCYDGCVNLKLCRISYEYRTNKTEIYTAEDWITDSNAINKKGSKLYPLSGKFRKKTIDRVEDIFKYISKIKQ
ncbi:MAG: DUF4468 domain-containing protein [Bacteroidales bacterium]|nr:DUF4468 domain-containing protein [Bacteroidales bacterium]MCM1147412.1 DUF4468 domain-containing protein [Bacteroidales bacterium]MCM1206081.1 DUF4468 domain-containing protein [Bacillota bacterium]MCM1510088.1 DUF4468 domain-containing protein [Clostridium sp.]